MNLLRMTIALNNINCAVSSCIICLSWILELLTRFERIFLSTDLLFLEPHFSQLATNFQIYSCLDFEETMVAIKYSHH